MFSPSSGNLNSLAPELAGALGGGLAGFGGAGGVLSFAADAGLGSSAGGAAGAACAGFGLEPLASAPSTVNITWPTLILSPSLTLMSLMTPVTDDGTSTTALSVSSSMTDWPAFTVAPGATIRRTRSPCAMF